MQTFGIGASCSKEPRESDRRFYCPAGSAKVADLTPSREFAILSARPDARHSARRGGESGADRRRRAAPGRSIRRGRPGESAPNGEQQLFADDRLEDELPDAELPCALLIGLVAEDRCHDDWNV